MCFSLCAAVSLFGLWAMATEESSTLTVIWITWYLNGNKDACYIFPLVRAPLLVFWGFWLIRDFKRSLVFMEMQLNEWSCVCVKRLWMIDQTQQLYYQCVWTVIDHWTSTTARRRIHFAFTHWSDNWITEWFTCQCFQEKDFCNATVSNSLAL